MDHATNQDVVLVVCCCPQNLSTVYTIKEPINCYSKNIIYQLNFKFCSKQDIGQTSNHLRVGMAGHKFSVFHKEFEKPVAEHANSHKQGKFENCYNLIGIK